MAERDAKRDRMEQNDSIEQGERSVDPARAATPGMPGHTAPAEQHLQHDRKGQAQSPRELTHNEPPKQKEGH